MKIYANLLGNWIELNEYDSINGLKPEIFISKHLVSENSYNDFKQTNEIVEIIKDNIAYHIHKSCIQYTYSR